MVSLAVCRRPGPTFAAFVWNSCRDSSAASCSLSTSCLSLVRSSSSWLFSPAASALAPAAYEREQNRRVAGHLLIREKKNVACGRPRFSAADPPFSILVDVGSRPLADPADGYLYTRGQFGGLRSGRDKVWVGPVRLAGTECEIACVRVLATLTPVDGFSRIGGKHCCKIGAKNSASKYH